MTNEVITMSQKEIDRLEILQKTVDNRATQIEAAEQLHITPRHMRRLQRRYAEEGVSGLLSKHRGKPSNHRLSDELKQAVISFAKEEQYQGFGPTFLHEKLTVVHKHYLSVESLRKLMIQEGLWSGKRRKTATVHQCRTRRSQYGELIQLDGSPHAWFEDRGPKCCLHVLIDDATGKLTALHFAEQECTEAYFYSPGAASQGAWSSSCHVF
jgi:transposase